MVKVEVFSDFICPWCYLGKARLKRLQEKMIDTPFSIHLRPYLLYPSIPPEGVDKSVFAKKRKPGMGRSLRAESKIEEIEINYQLIDRIPSSVEAHRLMELIPQETLKFQLGHKIFEAYFSQGVDIGKPGRLIEIVRRQNISEDIITTFLNSNQGMDSFENGIAEAKENYISLVPTLRLNNQFLVPGLQSIDIWEKYIRRAGKLQNKK